MALLGLVLLAGCASSTTTAAPPTTAVASADASSTPSQTVGPSPRTTPSVTAQPSGSTPATPTCTDADLSIGFGPTASPQTGEEFDVLAVRNVGQVTCEVRGYLSVKLNLHGTTTQPSVPDRGGMYVTSAAPKWVTVRPRQEAYVIVATYRCDQGATFVADSLAVSLPGSSKVTTLAITGSGVGSLPYCPNQPGHEPSSSSALQMSPISASVAAAAGA